MKRFSPVLMATLALCGAWIALVDAPRRVALEAGRSEANDSREAPSDFFFAQRAWPGGAIDPRRVDESFAQLGAMRAGAPSDLAALTWASVGPTNVGGRVTAIAAHAGSNVVWLGAAAGGVWRSNDGGSHWACTTDGAPITSVGALAMDPSDANVVYAGTGEANGSVDSYDGNGLWVTRDGGGSWRSLGLVNTRRIGAVAVNALDPKILFVAAMGSQFGTSPDRGVYRSRDGGLTWQHVLFVNDSTGACDVVLNPAHPETVWCATWERVRRATYRRAYGPGCGIWRSVDGGDTWTRMTTGLPAANDALGRIALAVAPSRPGTVYAQVGTGASLGYRGYGFYRSTDGGTTWAKRDAGATFADAFGGFCWYFGETAVDPANPDRVWALGVDLLRSDDGGVTWSGQRGSAHVDQHAIWIDPANPGRVLLGNDGGFFWSTAGGGAWIKSLNLAISQFYAGSVASYDPNKLVGGTQDNNSLLSTGDPTNWATTLGGDGFYNLTDPTSASILFSEWQNGCDRTGPRRSVNNGLNWTAPLGLVNTDRYNWCTPFAMNPADHNDLLLGSHRVWRSVDNGLHWSAVSGDLTRALPSSLVYGTITTLAYSPVDPKLWLVGTDDGRVWKSPDRGATWVEIGAALPRRWVTRVTPDPADVQRVWVTLSGFTQDEPLAHVWTSADQGASWTSASGNLPDLPVNDLLVDPQNPLTLYAATDGGVMTSRNRGLTWWDLGAGLPNVAVAELDLHAPTRTLFAFTHGRSAWKLALPAPNVGAPAAGTARGGLELSPPRPDPSRGPVAFTLVLEHPAEVDAAVFDASGRRVATVVRTALEAGAHALAWDGRSTRGDRVRAGVYWLRATAGSERRSARIVRVE